jgi:hypothetical protein
VLIALMMEAARTFETLVNFYQTTRRYNPEDSHLNNNDNGNHNNPGSNTFVDLVVVCLPLDPRFAGSNPAEDEFKSDNNP